MVKTHPATKQIQMPTVVVIHHSDNDPDGYGNDEWDEFLTPDNNVHVIELNIDHSSLNTNVEYVKLAKEQLHNYDPEGKSSASMSVSMTLQMHEEGNCYCCDPPDMVGDWYTQLSAVEWEDEEEEEF